MSGDIERISELFGENLESGAARAAVANREARYVDDATPRRTITLVLVLVIGFVLGVFGLISTTRGGTVNIGWLVLAIFVVAGLFLLYKKFEMGLLVFFGVCWIATGTPTMATGGSGGGQRLQISQMGLVILLLVWLTRRFVRREFTLSPTPANVPIILYLILCIWSTINGALLRDPAVIANSFVQYTQVNVIEIALKVLSLGGMILVAESLKGRELRWAAFVLILPGLIIFSRLLPFVHPAGYSDFPQILSAIVLVSFAATWRGKLWMRVLAGVIALALIVRFLILGVDWISGWLGVMAGTALILFIGQRRLFWIGCALLAILLLANSSYIYNKVFLSTVHSTDMDRFTMLYSSVRYATKFPLGIGVGNYRQYNAYYGTKWGTTSYTSAHSTYAQALAETGWLGLAALLLLIGSIVRMLYRYYRELPEGWPKAYALGVLGGFIGIIVSACLGDYIFPAYHNGGISTFGSTVYTFFMIGIVIALAREQGIIVSKADSQVETAAPVPIYNRPPQMPSRTSATNIDQLL